MSSQGSPGREHLTPESFQPSHPTGWMSPSSDMSASLWLSTLLSRVMVSLSDSKTSDASKLTSCCFKDLQTKWSMARGTKNEFLLFCIPMRAGAQSPRNLCTEGTSGSQLSLESFLLSLSRIPASLTTLPGLTEL